MVFGSYIYIAGSFIYTTNYHPHPKTKKKKRTYLKLTTPHAATRFNSKWLCTIRLHTSLLQNEMNKYFLKILSSVPCMAIQKRLSLMAPAASRLKNGSPESLSLLEDQVVFNFLRGLPPLASEGADFLTETNATLFTVD